MKKILVICGPTATGKTALAIKLAKKLNGEIISADSRQVYRYMNIGTGKDVGNSKFNPSTSSGLTLSEAEWVKISPFAPRLRSGLRRDKQIGYYLINGIRIWLYDIVKPDYQFSVADYVKCADLVVEGIWERGKLPILVGGTGFYIKALVDGIETIGIKPDWELRKILGYQDIKILREMLGKLDAKRLERMNESDRNNPRRLIRAIEIVRYKYTSEVSPRVRRGRPSTSEVKLADVLFIGLKSEYKTLYKKIDQRVDERVKKGVEREVKNLLKKGYTFENSALGTTLGYREWRNYFEDGEQGPEDRKQVVKRWKFDEHGYARRQMTLFRANPKVHWFDIIKDKYQVEIESLVKEWYDRN